MNLEYISKISALAQEIDSCESENIMHLASQMVEKIQSGNAIFTFGASHAGILSQEMFYRAGGLAVISPIFASGVLLDRSPITSTSSMENIAQYGKVTVEHSQIASGDLVVIHSVSGRNSMVIEFALEAKKRGAYVCAITNLTYTKQVSSKHPSGKNLFECADLVIDNHGELGDACVSLSGTTQKVAATSTISSILILNSAMSEACKKLAEKGVSPLPIFYSANMDGGKELNQKMVEKYKGQMKYEF